MNTTRMTIALALSLAAGCGRHSAAEEGSANTVQPDASAGPSFSLRLAGVDAGDYVSARMRVQAVQVTGGGKVLADTVKTPEVDLAQSDQAWLLTTFQAPADVEDVEFVLSFDRGAVATGAASFDVDARCQTLRIAGKVSRIAEHRHAVINLDVARSFVPSSVGMALVPHFRLVY